MVPLLHCCFCLSCSEQEEFPGFAPRNLGSDLHLLLINWVTMSEGTASPTPRPLSCQMFLQTKKLKKKKNPLTPPNPASNAVIITSFYQRGNLREQVIWSRFLSSERWRPSVNS